MLSTCTIPSDPGFQTNRRPNSAQRYDPNLSESRPKPRVKPEAISNAIKGQGSLALLFNPNSKPYTILSRPGSAQQKDFKKENAFHIKQIQRANRKKQEQATVGEPVKAVYKPDKFDHVESKVAQELKAPPRPPSRSNSATYLRAHSRNGPPVKDRPSSTEPVVPKECKLTVPKAAIAKEGSPPKKTRNHIAENIRRTASSPGPKRAPSALAMDEVKQKRKEEIDKYKKGIVPKYLKQRQKQWKQEEEIRIANTPDPSVPAGHVLMPRDERLQTLDALQKNQDELLVELRSLPVRVDTLRVRTRKAELERKLSEIESAIKIFSRPKVFVKVDD